LAARGQVKTSFDGAQATLVVADGSIPAGMRGAPVEIAAAGLS
jgi:hypothetical protein